jgi:hypothetical protein
MARPFLVLYVSLALCLTACGASGKKQRTSCDTDAECTGGVCFQSECYEACTGQRDCAVDELCVYADGATSPLCVVAAEYAGCADDAGCADVVTGACEAARCDPEVGRCEVTALDPCGAVPAFGAWRPLPAEEAPSARNYVGGAWTGTSFCLWGGYDGGSLGDGACYDPSTNSWRALPAEGAPSARCLMPEAWAGDRLCTWAGFDAGSSGACWIEDADVWSPMIETGAPSTPRQNHGVAWTGSELCFYGGRTAAGGTDLADGGCYEPVAGTWRALPLQGGPAGATNPSVLWLKDRLCVWGGWNASGFSRSGACWIPGAAAWQPIAEPPEAVAPFVDARAVGDRLCAWGGASADSATFYGTGACYAPATDHWTVLPTLDAPAARSTGHTSAWTGDWWCLLGGTVADEVPVAGGACYSPALDRWFPLPTEGAPEVGGEASAFWTGSELCVWGGRARGQNVAAGACLPVTVAP